MTDGRYSRGEHSINIQTCRITSEMNITLCVNCNQIKNSKKKNINSIEVILEL